MALKDTLIGRAVQSVKNYVSNAINDDQGWIRQGKFTPVQQIKSFVSSTIDDKGLVRADKFGRPTFTPMQALGDYSYKGGPTVREAFNKLPEQAQQDWGKAGLVRNNPLLQRYAPKVIEPLATVTELGPAAYMNTWAKAATTFSRDTTPIQKTWDLLGAYGSLNPAYAGRNVISGPLGVSFSGVSNKWQNSKDKKLIEQGNVDPNLRTDRKFLENWKQGWQHGQEFQFHANPINQATGILVDKIANYIPFLQKFTNAAIANNKINPTDSLKQAFGKWATNSGKQLIKAATLETIVETPIWATMTKTEKETYLEAVQREAVENLVMNVGMVGFNSTIDARNLAPIVKNSIDTAIGDYWKNASSPEGIALQSGKINFGAEIGDQPKTGGVSTPQNDLISEAKKYKSAEEFIKAQGTPVYHGTNETILENIKKEGLKPGRRGQLSLSTDENYAKSFAREGITPQGKTNSVLLRVNSDYIQGKTTTKRIDGKSRPLLDEKFELLTSETIPPEYLEVFQNGKWKPLKEGATPQIKTKSQLIDIWNKANKNNADDALINEARKYKSAEEFVRDARDGYLQGSSGPIEVQWGSAVPFKGEIPYTGLPTTVDPSIAKRFSNYHGGIGGTINKAWVKPNAKIIKFEELPNSFRSEEGMDAIEQASRWAKRNGYDGIDMRGTAKNPNPEAEIRIFNKDILEFDKNKLQSQLTDIWNKANKTNADDALIQEARKYSTLDDFLHKGSYDATPISNSPENIKWNTQLENDIKGLDRTTLLKDIPVDKKGNFTVDPNKVIEQKISSFNQKYGANITRQDFMDGNINYGLRNDLLSNKINSQLTDVYNQAHNIPLSSPSNDGGFVNKSFAIKNAKENISNVGETKFKELILKNKLPNEVLKKEPFAEEFVRAQGQLVYRGDATPIKLSEMDTTKVFNSAEKEALGAFNNTPGLYFTDSVANAKSYGKNLTEVYVKPTANIINVSDAPKILRRADVEKIIRSNPRIKDWAMNWDENFDKAIKQITDSVMAEKDGNEFLKAIWADGGFEPGDFTNAMKKFGIDGITVPKEGVNHFVIYNKDSISQSPISQPKTGGVEGVTVKSPIKVQPSSKIQVKPKEKIQIPTQPTLKIPTTETSQPIIPKERGFITTVKQAEQTKIPVKQKVQGTYEPISNKETLSQAQKIVSQNYDTAKSRVYNEPLTAETNLIGQELVRKAQTEGRYDEAIEIIETMAKKGTESGQGIQAFSVWQRLTPEGMLKYAQKEIKNANENAGFLTKVFRKGETKLSKETAQFITEQMTKVQKMADGIEKDKIVQSVMERINKEIPIGASEIFDAYRYQNLLSSPRTQLRNAYQNAYQALINRPLTMASEATVDWVKSTLKGTERTKYMSDVPAYYKGLWNSRIDANNAFMNIWRGKENFTNLDINQIRNKNLPKSLTVVGRLMEGADKYFQSLIGGGEYARMMKNGATEEQAKIAAKKMAEYSLLRNLPDPKNKNGQGYVLSAIDGATQGVTELGRRIPALRWFIPFIRTPMNAAKQWIEYSPAGILTTAGAKDKSSQVAKALIGTAITGWGASLAMQDRTTWSAPTDSKEKELFYASGKKPYSIRFGDKWIPMTYFGPQALALAIPAAFKQYNEDSRTALTDNQVEKATKAVTSLLGFFSEQTFLQGLGNFVRAISGDTDYTYAGNISGNISQIIPLSSLQRYVSQIVDPVFRKTGGGTMTEQVVNQLKTQIPGLSKTLEPYKLPTGEVSTRNITDYIAPYTMGLEKPEYNQLLEDRQTKLQENAVLNKAKKEIVSGKSKQIGNNIVYTNENGNPAVLDLTKYDKIAQLPSDNKYNSAIKESKQYSEAAKIIDNDGLDEEQKETALKRLGVNKEDAQYYSLANDNTNLKTMFVLDSVANKTHAEILDTLAKQRKQVNGNMVATNTVLDNLVDEGVITKAEATQLKKYKFENGKLTPMKKSSGGKKISVKLRKVGRIKFKKAKVTKIKTAQKFAKIKFQKYTPLKVKKYT